MGTERSRGRKGTPVRDRGSDAAQRLAFRCSMGVDHFLRRPRCRHLPLGSVSTAEIRPSDDRPIYTLVRVVRPPETPVSDGVPFLPRDLSVPIARNDGLLSTRTIRKDGGRSGQAPARIPPIEKCMKYS